MSAITEKAELARILERVKKLLALSRSSNPHEAAAAAEKAQEMMFRYNLDIAEVAASTDGGWAIAETYLGSMTSIDWKRRLIIEIARVNYCEAIYYPGKPISVVVGRRHNVKLVEHLYEYLHREIERLADAGLEGLRPRPRSRASWRTNFCHGAVDILSWRLWEKRRSLEGSDPRSRALVPAEEAGLQRFIGDTWPNITKGTLRSAAGRPGYAAGVRAGERIRLDDALEGGGRWEHLALPGLESKGAGD